VTPSQVLTRLGQDRSNAALYAFGKITECRADAGPAWADGETVEETEAIFKRRAGP